MAWNGFFAMKELSKMIFVDFILFNQIGHEKFSFWSSLKEVKEQSEAVFVDNTFANVQCDVESLALFFLYTCVTMYFSIKTCTYFAYMCSKL